MCKNISNYTSNTPGNPLQLYLKERKCFFFISIYKLPSQNSQYSLNSISRMPDFYSKD